MPSATALETTRTNARTAGRAAVASLNVGAATPLTYAADATDSSGGEGVDPPAPESMEVKYAAEGLDGLATALEQAMDGAAPRNLDDETGAAISAPLIGSNLDAGAGVPKILRDLTSQLRNKLDLPAVTGAETAADLETALETATKGAVNATPGLEDVSSATAEVTCAGGECEPCDPPAEGEEPEPCATEGPTAWENVSISVNLTGTSKTGKTPFDTGLPGLELRSDYEVDTSTSWTLPITLELARGVGPQIRIDEGEALELDVAASLPSGGIKAIVGYLPAKITAATEAERSMDTTIRIEPEVPEGEPSKTYNLFQLYDGELTAQPSFADRSVDETGLKLNFETVAGDSGTFDLTGNIDIPWSAEDGFVEDVTYNQVQLDMGEVVDAIATPFDVVDPYLAPVRDVIDVLRTPIPVVSDLSELGGAGEVSLLSLLETLSAATKKPQLELAYRVIGLIDGVTAMVGAIAALKAKPGRRRRRTGEPRRGRRGAAGRPLRGRPLREVHRDRLDDQAGDRDHGSRDDEEERTLPGHELLRDREGQARGGGSGSDDQRQPRRHPEREAEHVADHQERVRQPAGLLPAVPRGPRPADGPADG